MEDMFLHFHQPVVNIMSRGTANLPIFIKVEGQSFSNHRNPQGVYKVEVVEEKTIVHSAFAALLVARESIPFLDENADYFTLRAFLEDGREVVVPRSLNTSHEMRGFFCGRSKNYPEAIAYE